jgi:two-component sensor histidine kinase
MLAPRHSQISGIQALPCGLLINELLSNSLKHGFPQGGKGIVKVELKFIDGRVHLSVSDTGVGLAPDFNLQQLASLGLHLVSDLAKQLGGTLQIETGQGTISTVIFMPKNTLLPVLSA